jgi:hypothetical protein
VIYLDTSVALAHLLAEDRSPPESLWQEPLIASRLLEYELWNRIHARGLGRSHGEEKQTTYGSGRVDRAGSSGSRTRLGAISDSLANAGCTARRLD